MESIVNINKGASSRNCAIATKVLGAIIALIIALAASFAIAALQVQQAQAATIGYAVVYSNGTTSNPEFTMVMQKTNTTSSSYGTYVKTYEIPEVANSIDGSVPWSPGNIDAGGYADYITKIIIKDALKPTGRFEWFKGFGSLKTIEGLSLIDTSGVESMTGLFRRCTSLTSIDLSGFNTLNVKSMDGMFSDCSSLAALDVSKFNTSSILNFGNMFAGCTNLKTLNLKNFNTAKAHTFNSMFEGCSSLTSLDLSSFNTSNMDNVDAIFHGCSSLKEVNLSSWNTSKVPSSEYNYHNKRLFSNCGALTKISLGSGWNIPFSELGSPSEKKWYRSSGAELVLTSIPGADVYTTVKPTPSTVVPTAISVSPTSFSLTSNGATRQLSATVSPSNATSKTVVWSTSNSSVATVTSSGLVAAVGNGSATITARTSNGKTATSKVTVSIPVQPTSVKVNQSAFTLSKKSASKTLTATVSPSNAANKSVSWSSSNTSVAKVSSAGKVTPGTKNGTAYITAKTANGKTAKVKVTVKIVYPTKVDISTKAFTLTKKGATKIVAYKLSGSGITDKTLTWTSSNKKVATVSSTGKVTAVANGTATIKVKTANGKMASVKATVKTATQPTSVSLSATSATLTKKGAKKQLTATVKPTNATNKKVTWTTSNSKVATVSSAGKVTAVANGTATITAKTANGKTAKCTVKVSIASSVSEEVQLAKDIFTAYNNYRASKGLKKATWSDAMASQAIISAKNCVSAKNLEHTVKYRVSNYSDILQNATWKMTGTEAVNNWKNSTGHRKMMQCTTATQAGVGVYKTASGVWYYVIVYNFTGTNQGGS